MRLRVRTWLTTDVILLRVRASRIICGGDVKGIFRIVLDIYDIIWLIFKKNLLCCWPHYAVYWFQVLDRAQGNDWHYAHFCVINQGGIRVDIDPGGMLCKIVCYAIYAKILQYLNNVKFSTTVIIDNFLRFNLLASSCLVFFLLKYPWKRFKWPLMTGRIA